MIYGSVIAISALLAIAVSYRLGYAKGCSDTAFEENSIGREAFNLHVWWGAEVGRSRQDIPLISVADEVRRKREQLSRLTMEELIAVRTSERQVHN